MLRPSSHPSTRSPSAARPRLRARRAGAVVALVGLAFLASLGASSASFYQSTSGTASFAAGVLTGPDAPAAGVTAFAAAPTLGGCDLSWTALAGGTNLADRLAVDDRGRELAGINGTGAGLASDVPPEAVARYRLRSRTGPWSSADVDSRFATCAPMGVSGLGPGRFFTCALRVDGSLWCWGWIPQQAISPAPVLISAGPYREVGSMGTTVVCAIRTDGTLWCFGTGTSGQLGQGTTTSSASPVKVGAATTWRQLGQGADHVCATRTDDTLWCWGANGFGQLGDGTTANRTSPVQIGGSVWRRVWGGERGTCAQRLDGTVWCWGSNSNGQVGNGSTATAVTVPTQVGTATDWLQMTLGRTHTCGIRSDETLWCWGGNTNAQLGDATFVDSLAPLQVVTPAATGWLQVSAQISATCALRTDRTPWCWGAAEGGRTGQPGLITLQATPLPPLQVGSRNDWVTLASGAFQTCVVDGTGAAWCWGDDRVGDLGSDATLFANPRQVTTGSWVSASAALFAGCAVKTDTTLWCSGNQALLIGDPTITNGAPEPRQLAGTGYASVVLGGSGGCALRTDASLWCWGSNGSGQIGDGTTTARTQPTATTPGMAWAQVSLGSAHSCGIRADSTLWCWGSNGSGRLGIGSASPATSAVPLQVGSSTWKRVALGNDHACAIEADDTLWCWGLNGAGQLGDGTTTNRLAPVQVGTGTWQSVSAGTSFTCGIRTDLTLWCWGLNSGRQLGDGTTTNRLAPVQIGAALSWQSLAASASSACAAATDTMLWCWGTNTWGELGRGTFTTDGDPAAVGLGFGDLSAVSAPFAGGSYAIKPDGTWWAWGRNDQYVLGVDGARPVAVAVLGGTVYRP